jgi:hypothetical protein
MCLWLGLISRRCGTTLTTSGLQLNPRGENSTKYKIAFGARISELDNALNWLKGFGLDPNHLKGAFQEICSGCFGLLSLIGVQMNLHRALQDDVEEKTVKIAECTYIGWFICRHKFRRFSVEFSFAVLRNFNCSYRNWLSLLLLYHLLKSVWYWS